MKRYGNLYLKIYDMNNLILAHNNARKGKGWYQEVKMVDEYFRKELKLTIKGNWQVFPTFIRGIDFVGYRTFLNYKLLRKSTCNQMKKKMIQLQKKVIEDHQLMNYSEWCSINSYKGWLIHCDSFRLSQKYVVPLEAYANAYYEEFIKKGGTKK